MVRVLDRFRRAPKIKTSDFTPRLSYFALEQRTVFDAAAVATVDDASKHSDSHASTGQPPADTSPDPSHSDLAACLSQVPAVDNAKSVAFVDATAGNNPAVFGRVPAGADIILLDPKRDAARQIAEYLSQQPDRECVLLVSSTGIRDLSSVVGLYAGDTQQATNEFEIVQIQQQLSSETSTEISSSVAPSTEPNAGTSTMDYGGALALPDTTKSIVGIREQNSGDTNSTSPADSVAAESGFLQQFTTSGGEVLGFGKDSIIVASLDHVLRVDLVGANATTPVSQAAATTADSDSTGAPALHQVTYANVWNGVTLVYDAAPGSIVESSYFVDAGSSANAVDQIQLHYNRDVSLDANGNLVIQYDTGT
jgi:hypothetical protein